MCVHACGVVCMCICRLMHLHLCVEAEGDLQRPSQLFFLFSLFLCKNLKKLLFRVVCVHVRACVKL